MIGKKYWINIKKIISCCLVVWFVCKTLRPLLLWPALLKTTSWWRPPTPTFFSGVGLQNASSATAGLEPTASGFKVHSTELWQCDTMYYFSFVAQQCWRQSSGKYQWLKGRRMQVQIQCGTGLPNCGVLVCRCVNKPTQTYQLSFQKFLSSSSSNVQIKLKFEDQGKFSL